MSGDAKKRRRERLRIPMHVRRVRADLRVLNADPSVPPTTLEARIMFNDISLSGAGIFCTQMISSGREIELLLGGPQNLTLRGKVVWCQEYMSSTHVVSATPFTHRAGIQFTFKDAAEETTLKKLYEDFAKDVLFGNQA